MYAIQLSGSVQMSEPDYLAFDDEQLEKYECCGGSVYAMTGGSVRHNGDSTHLSNLLRNTQTNCKDGIGKSTGCWLS